ncbi:MAG: DUF898 family protein [Clostridia bacterium]|nr:DUF898 family protein [Clostridia bacterium]
MPFCKKCGTSFDGKFCPHCGTKAARYCPNCGSETEENGRFCSTCGEPLNYEAELHRPEVIEEPVEVVAAPIAEETGFHRPEIKSEPAEYKYEGKHSEAPEETSETYESKFTGGAIARAARLWVVGFVSLITIGLAYPAMYCWYMRWQTSHTYLNGRKLVFDGKGGQLFGKYILWTILTIITLGLYYIFAARINMLAWQTKHTHFEGVEISDEDDKKSKFTGNGLQLIGVDLLTGFVTLITLTFGMYWAYCYRQRWLCKHTVIDGHTMYFDGKALQYFGKCVLWCFLTIITFGIYSFWMAVNSLKWTTKHTLLHEPADLPYYGKKANAAANVNTPAPRANTNTNTTTSTDNGSKNNSNSLPIVGFVLSIMPNFSFIGLIISIVALAKINDSDGKNKGFAIAGIIIPIVYFVIGFLVGLLVLPAIGLGFFY